MSAALSANEVMMASSPYGLRPRRKGDVRYFVFDVLAGERCLGTATTFRAARRFIAQQKDRKLYRITHIWHPEKTWIFSVERIEPK